MNRGGLKVSSSTYNFSLSGTRNTEALLYKVLLLISQNASEEANGDSSLTFYPITHD